MGRPSKMAEVTGLLCGPAGQQGQVHAWAKPAASPGAWFGAGEAVGTRLIHCHTWATLIRGGEGPAPRPPRVAHPPKRPLPGEWGQRRAREL